MPAPIAAMFFAIVATPVRHLLRHYATIFYYFAYVDCHTLLFADMLLR